MKKEDLRTIIKILLIGGIVLVALAQIISWGEISTSDLLGVGNTAQFYSWGSQTSSVLSMGSSTNFYFEIITDENSSAFFASEEFSFLIVPVICSMLVLPICLFALFFGCLEYRDFIRKEVRVGLFAGLFTIAAIILFYIFIQFGIFSISSMVSASYDWSAGFSMMILAVILFFSAYVLSGKYETM